MAVSIHWTGLLDWTTGLDHWTGLLDSRPHPCIVFKPAQYFFYILYAHDMHACGNEWTPVKQPLYWT